MVWAAAGAGIAALMVGGAVSEAVAPASSSHALSSHVLSSPTSSAAPSSAAVASSTALDAPVSTSSAAPTSAAVAPVLLMTCPGTGAAPTFAHRITAAAPYTVAIDYGDGDRYSNDDRHLDSIFTHRYLRSGTFTVGAVLTDATGQTTTATCAYSWVAPVRVAAPVPGGTTHRSTTGTTHSSTTGTTHNSTTGTSPSAPAGATARCNDGTWSSSQTHRGTCSHHGGVAEWL